MKKFNIVFLFIVLLFIGISKNLNLNTSNKISNNTSNVSSDISTNNDYNIPYVDNSLITFTTNSDGTATIKSINATTLEGIICIPDKVYSTDGTKHIVTKITGYQTADYTNSGNSVFLSDSSKPNTAITGIYLPDTLTEIGPNTFIYMNSVYDLIIPKNVTYLGQDAFYQMAKLEKIYILGNVSEITYNLFGRSDSLKSIYYFGDGITKWEPRGSLYDTQPNRPVMYFKSAAARSNAASIISATDKTILTLSTDYTYQYSDTDSLVYTINGKTIRSTVNTMSSVVVHKKINNFSITTIGAYTFGSNPFITSVDIEDGITSIESTQDYNKGAFSYSYGIKNINLPATLTTIGDSAFTFTYSTFNVDNILPESVTSIGSNSFSASKSITSLTLGSNVTTVADSSFNNCDKLKVIYINSSKLTSFGLNTNFNGTTPSDLKLFFKNSDVYKKTMSLFSSVSNKCIYKVSVKYLNTGLLNNPSFITSFQSDLNSKNPVINDNGIIIYTYYAGDDLLIPKLQDFEKSNTNITYNLALYTSSDYSTYINLDNNTSTDSAKEILNGKLVKGVIGDDLTIYCNLSITPTNDSLKNDYTIVAYNDNNSNIGINNFTIDDLGKNINLRFTSDETTGITGLPVVGYTYEYEWSIKSGAIYNPIQNENSSELTLLPESGADLNSTYRCIVNVLNTSGKLVATTIKDVNLTFNKQDIIVDIKNQSVNNVGAISSIYGIDYTASINGVELRKEEMDIYFEPNYGLVTKADDNQTVISFIGILKDSSTYQTNTIQTGILTTKTNSTNLILISVTSGLFVVEVIVFMVVIFKQRSRE